MVLARLSKELPALRALVALAILTLPELPAFDPAEWQVMESPIEFHSQKPDTGVGRSVRLRLCGSSPSND